MSWFSLSDSQLGNGQVLFRFVPSPFLPQYTAPVVEVTVEDPSDAQAAVESLSRFRSEFIVSLEVKPHELCVLGHMDNDETVVKGARVYSSNVAYSSAELLDIATFLQNALRDKTTDLYRQRERLKEVRHFVADLAQRAGRKVELSGKPTAAAEAQVDVLSRVLNRIGDA